VVATQHQVELIEVEGSHVCRMISDSKVVPSILRGLRKQFINFD